MVNSSELESLKAVFSDYPEIEGVYLFGSAASDQKAQYEDIDVGIVHSDPAIEDKKADLYAALVKQGLDNVDIVFFNNADLVLQFEIIHHNKLIYRKEDFNHAELFSVTIRKYFDFKPYLDRQREAYKKRILNG